jgi:hypothetical protein
MEMTESWTDIVGSGDPPEREDNWTFDEFRRAMRLWLEAEDAPEYFSANDLVADKLPRMKHLGPWLGRLAKAGWIERPTAKLANLSGVYYGVESSNPKHKTLVTVWRNLLPIDPVTEQEMQRNGDGR